MYVYTCMYVYHYIIHYNYKLSAHNLKVNRARVVYFRPRYLLLFTHSFKYMYLKLNKKN